MQMQHGMGSFLPLCNHRIVEENMRDKFAKLTFMSAGRIKEEYDNKRYRHHGQQREGQKTFFYFFLVHMYMSVRL